MTRLFAIILMLITLNAYAFADERLLFSLVGNWKGKGQVEVEENGEISLETIFCKIKFETIQNGYQLLGRCANAADSRRFSVLVKPDNGSEVTAIAKKLPFTKEEITMNGQVKEDMILLDWEEHNKRVNITLKLRGENGIYFKILAQKENKKIISQIIAEQSQK